MRVSILRSVLCWLMPVLIPATLLGQDIPTKARAGAILRTQGGVWVNGYEATDSSAVFAGDLIETKAGFSANLTVEGSTILMGPQSLAKFGDNFVELEHGAVSVGSSTKFEVRIDCMHVVPVLAEWTQYDVTDVNRSVQVAAHKDDVNVQQGARRVKGVKEEATEQRASVHEGEQHNYSQNELCGAPAPPARAGGLDTKWIEIGAGGGGAAILCALLCRGSGGSNKAPMSNSSP